MKFLKEIALLIAGGILTSPASAEPKPQPFPETKSVFDSFEKMGRLRTEMADKVSDCKDTFTNGPK